MDVHVQGQGATAGPSPPSAERSMSLSPRLWMSSSPFPKTSPRSRSHNSSPRPRVALRKRNTVATSPRAVMSEATRRAISLDVSLSFINGTSIIQGRYSSPLPSTGVADPLPSPPTSEKAEGDFPAPAPAASAAPVRAAPVVPAPPLVGAVLEGEGDLAGADSERGSRVCALSISDRAEDACPVGGAAGAPAAACAPVTVHAGPEGKHAVSLDVPPHGASSHERKPSDGTRSRHASSHERNPSDGARGWLPGFKRTRRPQADSPNLPGLPMPPSLLKTFRATPEDATCLERGRDSTLLLFAHPVIAKTFLVFAVLVSLAVIGMGLIMCWAMLGLFFDFPNGWEEQKVVCTNSSGWPLTDMSQMSVPKDPANGEYVTDFCNDNQWWFNTCMKVFVVLFSYVNFLPIPWRLAILHHVYCSHRPSEAGVDFYGRPSDSLWFNIPRKKRRKIAIGLNLAWMAHFACVATHIVWAEFIQGQTWPGVLYHNLPFVLSITFQVIAAVVQSRAEARLIAEQPERFPQKPMKIVCDGYRKWRSGEVKGRLRQVIRAEFEAELERNPNKKRGV